MLPLKALHQGHAQLETYVRVYAHQPRHIYLPCPFRRRKEKKWRHFSSPFLVSQSVPTFVPMGKWCCHIWVETSNQHTIPCKKLNYWQPSSTSMYLLILKHCAGIAWILVQHNFVVHASCKASPLWPVFEYLNFQKRQAHQSTVRTHCSDCNSGAIHGLTRINLPAVCQSSNGKEGSHITTFQANCISSLVWNLPNVIIIFKKCCAIIKAWD